MRVSYLKWTESLHSISDLRRGGVFAAMRTSFALPERNAFSEDW
jgi:hypothetical protein